MNSPPDPASDVTPSSSGIGRHAEMVRIVLIYAGFASLWILVSDRVVSWMFSDPNQLVMASIIKGWLFVAVTALLLYWLMRRLLGVAPVANAASHGRGSVLALLLLTAAIAGIAGIAIKAVYQQHEEKEIQRLKTIATIKTDQIADWVRERRGDANYLHTSAYFAEHFQRWRDSGDGASRDRMQRRLEAFRQENGINAVLLLDSQGNRLWGTEHAPAELDPALLGAARQALADGEIAMVGPYRDRTGRVHLDFVAPLHGVSDRAPCIVLHIDPAQWLFPTLQTWPIPSDTGETLLFRRDGEQVLYLNELRHWRDTAAKLRVPLATAHLLAGQILLGRSKLGEALEGVDYRGVPVVGVERKIPGTDWFLSAELDKEELHGEAHQMAIWIALTGFLALFMALTGLHLSRQRHELELALRTSQAQGERLRALRLLAAIADSSNDAILAKDLEGRYLLFNRAAEEFVGKSAEEVLGKDDFFLFPPEEAEFLQALGRRAIEENRIIVEEEVLTTPGGVRTFLATKGPLHDDHGKVVGQFSISRDITESKNAQERLAEQMNRFRFLLDHSRDGIVIIDQAHKIIEANQRFADMLGYEHEALFGLHTWDFDAALSEQEIRSGFADLQSTSRVFETRHRRKDGSVFDVEVSASGTRWAGQNLVLCICRDISQRKQTQAQLQLWANAFEHANFGLAITDARNGTYLAVNPTFARERGYRPEELVGRPFLTVYPEDLREAVKTRVADVDQVGHGVFESEHMSKDGRRFPVLMDITVVRDADGRPLNRVAYALDITERKRAEAELLFQSKELKQHNEELERFNRLTVGRELDMIELKQRVNALSRELGREPPYPLAFLDNTERKDAP